MPAIWAGPENTKRDGSRAWTCARGGLAWDPMKIGLIFAHSGLAGLWTPGCHGGAILAAAELNAAGGVLGQEVTLVTADGGETVQSAFRAAQHLAIEDRVDAVIGLQSSNLRSAVRNGLAGLAPYIYTAHYEGGFCGPGLATLGSTDAETLPPAIGWLARHRSARRFFFLGNDYIWPRVTYGLAEGAVQAAGARLVGRSFMPLGQRDFAAILDRIRHSGADAVIMALLGEDAVAFNRAFGQAGLAARAIRLSLAFDETQLLGVMPENAEGLHAVQSYFCSSRDHDRDAMMENYDCSFAGLRPAVTANAVSCYDGIRMAAALARHIGRVDGHLMARALRKPLNPAEAGALLGRARPPLARLAEADGTEFRVVETL